MLLVLLVLLVLLLLGPLVLLLLLVLHTRERALQWERASAPLLQMRGT